MEIGELKPGMVVKLVYSPGDEMVRTIGKVRGSEIKFVGGLRWLKVVRKNRGGWIVSDKIAGLLGLSVIKGQHGRAAC